MMKVAEDNNTPLAFVTGATGAVGPALVGQLLDGGYRVRALVRQPQAAALPAPVELVPGDLAEVQSWRTALQGVDVLFHMAAKLHINNPGPELRAEYERVNVDGTARLLDAAESAGVGRIVFASTIAIYGPTSPGQLLDECAPPRPDSLYAETKCRAEQLVLTDSRAVVLRLAAVYGPRMKGNYARLLRALRRGLFVPVGAGHNRRTLVHEVDVARALRLAAEHPAAPGQIFNVTDGTTPPFRAILAAMAAAVGRTPPRLHLPVAPLRLALAGLEQGLKLVGKRSPVGPATLAKLLEDVAVSGAKIQRELGFRPAYDTASGWRETAHQINILQASS